MNDTKPPGSLNTQQLGLTGIARNTALTVTRWLGSMVVGFAFAMLIARLLGPEGNGQYAIAVLLPNIFSLVLSLGVGPANVYHLGRGATDVRTVFRGSILLWSLLSGFGLAGGLLVILLVGETIFPTVSVTFLIIGLLSFPVSLLGRFLQSIFQGLQDFKRYNILLIAGPVATFLLAVLLLVVIRGGVLAAIFSYLLGQAGAAFLSLSFAVSEVHRENEGCEASRKDYVKASLAYGWKIHLSNIFAYLNYRADLFLLNYYLSAGAVGLYFVAVQITERGWFIAQGVSTVLLPRLAQLEQDEQARRTLTPLVSRWVLLASAGMAIVIAIAVRPFVVFVFGGEFIASAGVVWWLLPGMVMLGVSKVLSNDLAARGLPERNMLTAGSAFAANVVANILLIPAFGIEGAAIATTLSSIVHLSFSLVQYVSVSDVRWWDPLLVTRGDVAQLWLATRRVWLPLFR